MKDLLISHTDLDGISPTILLNLTGRKFDSKNIEINEVDETFEELFKTDLSVYENIYVTDLTLTENVYKGIQEHDLVVKVFDHHETHLFANEYPNTKVMINLNNRPTCGTELFYDYLKNIYPEVNTPIIKEYVELVRQIDTFDLESDIPKQLEILRSTYGRLDFIKKMTRRLKKNTEHFEFTAFEKRFLKIRQAEENRYLELKDDKMLIYEIDNHLCGITFAERHKSDLGNYLSLKHPELDLIIIIDASKSISYRTARDDVSVADFASVYGGGGHRKASGSRFDEEMRDKIINIYFKDVKRLEKALNQTKVHI